MMNETTVASSRRQFLKFLACSPLIATPGALWWQKEFLDGTRGSTSSSQPMRPSMFSTLRRRRVTC